nr:hypothetical protein [Bacteroidota bacterium]
MDFTYQCVNCSKEIQTEELIYLCPDCSVDNTPEIPPKGVLKIIYDYDTIIKDYGGGDFFYDLKNVGFIDLLPIKYADNLPGLKIGNTPLYEMDQFDGKSLNGYLYLKDDSQNPTFS